MHENSAVYDLGYLLASAFFIFSLKLLSSPRTARKGNLYGAIGMLLAVVVTLLKVQVETGIIGWEMIGLGLGVGSILGLLLALRVQMTAMPEMVGMLNGFGGGASALVAVAEALARDVSQAPTWSLGRVVLEVAIGLSLLIGWVTLTGSVMAVLKLSEKLKKNVVLPQQNLIKGTLLLGTLAGTVGLIVWPSSVALIVLLSLAASLLGVLLVLSIGGGDMPVVISFLNSLSGLAAGTTGFVVNNSALIIGGALVGASGLILTGIMCKAMNRSFRDVLLKTYGGGGGAKIEKRSVQGYEAEDAAMAFDGVRTVIIVPGYGMAVSQCQHVVREVAEELERRGAEVKYAIHPVAGRMPGHMNVLLAEANVPYDKLYELEAINPSFGECDVALVVGANDTINPAAKTDPTGPLGGMPVLDVEKARTVIIVKRSLSPGYAGVDNELFYKPSTMMLFGDGKKRLSDLLAALKEL